MKYKSRDLSVGMRGFRYCVCTSKGVRSLMRKARRTFERNQLQKFLATGDEDIVWNIRYNEVSMCDFWCWD